MIVKTKDGKYKVVSDKVDPKTGKHRHLGTYESLEEAKKRIKQVEYFKHINK